MCRHVSSAHSEAMTGLVGTALVRAAALGSGVAASYALLPVLVPDEGEGANIGAGLLVFAVLVTASAVWGFLDGASRPFVLAAAAGQSTRDQTA